MDETRSATFENSPQKRAFVVQFEPIHGARSPLRGRVEAVASGEAAHFRSLKQLVGFMAGALRKQASGAQRCDP